MASMVQLVAAAHEHSRTESIGDLEGIMATMEGEPVYEFYPVGLCFRGMANTRRYYEHFVSAVRARIVGSTLHSEAIGEAGVVQEYTVSLTHPGDAQPTSHRIIAILTFGEQGLSGERMYSDERLFRTLLGPVWEELEPVR